MSHHFNMFGGYWCSASEDMKYLIYHVTSQNHVIKGSSNFLSGSCLWYLINLKLAIGIIVVEI